MSSGALRQLFASFDVDTGAAVAKLGQLNSKIASTKDVLGSIAGVVLGAFSLHGIASFVESMIDLGSSINDMAERLGVGTDELQRFQYAAGLSGVNAEEAGRALGFLSKNVGEAIGGNKEAVAQFAQLGLELKGSNGEVRELGDLIPEVADRFANMGSSQERTAMAMKLFGKSGASLIPLLQEGGDGLAKLNAQFDELGLGLSADFVKAADDTGDSLDTMKLAFRGLKSQIALEFFPSLTAATEKCTQWIAMSRRFARETNAVKIGMGALGVGAAAAAGKVVYSWSKVLGLFPKDGNLIGNLFKVGQVGLIVGAFALLALGIEDIVTMCQGGESVIGDFLDQFGGVGEKQKLVDSLRQSWELMKPAIADLGPLLLQSAKSFAEALPYMIAGVADLFRVVASTVEATSTWGKLAKDVVTGADTSKTWEEHEQNHAKIWGAGSAFVNAINAPARVPASAAGVYGPPAPPNVQMNGNKTIVNVNGAGDPADVAQRVSNAQQGANETMLADAAAALALGPI